MIASRPSAAPEPNPLRLVQEHGIDGASRLLTIVITSYNHCRYLPEAFAAIEASGVCQRLALMVVDDGSTDGTMEFLTSYGFDPALHVRIFDKENAGLTDSLARGLSQSRTKFVAFIASDDCYEPEGLASAVERLERSEAQDLCWIFQARYREGRDGELVYQSNTPELLASCPPIRERRLSIEFPKPMLLQSTVFTTQLLRDIGAWSDQLRLDDWPVFVKVARASRSRSIDMVGVMDIVLCHYRVHENGVHHNLERQLSVCLEVAQTGVDKAFRREAIANVYSDVALIYLNRGDMIGFATLFLKALVARPHLRTVTRVFGRIGSSMVRRAQQIIPRSRL